MPSQALRASSPKGRAFWIHLYTILPYFPPCHKAKWPENSQNGQKSRKNACKSLCRRPPEPKNAGGKTPESPKIPLQLGCSVTQIRHFFKRTFFNLPLIFENNVKKATVWLHQGGKTSPSMLRIATARVAAPSVCFAVACILLAAAPTAPSCFRRWRWSSPLLLTRGGLGSRVKLAGYARGSPTRGAGGRKPD